MSRYAEAPHKRSVFAVCLSQAAEAYHHWRVFAPSSSGVCIEFRKAALLAAVPKVGYSHRKVKYKKPVELLGGYVTQAHLPFIKGWAYRDEKEYRIVYTSEDPRAQSHSFPIDLSTIQAVILSPWLPRSLVETACATIAAIEGCSAIPVLRSAVVENEAWIAYVRQGV